VLARTLFRGKTKLVRASTHPTVVFRNRNQVVLNEMLFCRKCGAGDSLCLKSAVFWNGNNHELQRSCAAALLRSLWKPEGTNWN
ncbi:MAG: hypothetical protein JW959_02100, partial [Pirellulales bacterium]|nr:hypothetical protein [Pirellulales bacterium]